MMKVMGTYESGFISEEYTITSVVMTRLTPNFLRVFIKTGLFLLLFFGLYYFQRGYQYGVWWESDYPLAAVLLLTIAPTFMWFAFVPSLLEFSHSEITISMLLRKSTYRWDDLYCYGTGRGVYLIQFSVDRQPYQIFKGAYSKAEWSKLINFMTEQFPDRAASGFSIGPWIRPKGEK